MKTNVARKPAVQNREATKGVVALAGGWVPVSSAEVCDICKSLEELGDAAEHSARVGSVTRDTPRTQASARKAIVIRHCADQLRRHAAAMNSRQPALNVAYQPRGQNADKLLP